MIQNLFVSTELGELVYAKNVADNRMDVDENILIGFLTAIDNFSKEAFKTYIKLLDIDNRRKLVIHYQQKEHLIVAAIVDGRDDVGLVQSILKNLAMGLVTEYGNKIDPEGVDKALVDRELGRILKGKAATRNPKISLLALLLSIGFAYPLVWGGVFASFLISTSVLTQVMSSSSDALFVFFLPGMLYVVLIYTSITFIFPSLVSGFVSGQFKHAVAIGVILWAFVLVVGTLISKLFFDSTYILYIFLSYTPVVFIFNFFFSYVGVLISTKKKLYK
ncbi:MAG: hypothetical protein JW839_03185 [Candidatus Lokiarchaeota archaeon]|nr:hypothetical protein [Candidatus Lokiarchaeota archaeon]